MRNWLPVTCVFLLSLTNAYSAVKSDKGKKQVENPPDPTPFQGWSFDVGGQYTWMLFTTPNATNFSGSSGGVHGSITHQKSDSIFVQARSYWNGGHITTSSRGAHENEFYTDLLAGYCFSTCWDLMVTPYVGLGFDFLNDHKTSTSFVDDVKLKYRLNYGIIGVDVRYVYGQDWAFGGQVECFPTFQQHLSIEGVPGSAWKLNERVGWNVRTPIAYRLVNKIWLEFGPYYRYLPLGKSNTLSLPHRNLNEIGALITFRFFL